MDFKCDELILGKKDADSRALTEQGLIFTFDSHKIGSLQFTGREFMNFAQPSGRRNIDLTQRGMWLQPFGVGEVKSLNHHTPM
jgi:hypothetical protein